MKKSFNIIKMKKDWINFFRDNFNTEEFKKYLEKEGVRSEKSHLQYLEENSPELLNRKEYGSDRISGVILYDVLSNEGIIRLLKKIYGLSKKKYEINCRYKKPTLFKKYDYIHLDYFSNGYGVFAEINFLNDEYIKSIEINWGQIDNYFAIIEYRIKFVELLNDNSYVSYILSNIDKLSLNYYLPFYQLEGNVEDNYHKLKNNIDEMFRAICQYHVTNLCYSEYGLEYPLSSIVAYTREKKIDIKKTFLGDFSFTYYNKQENYFIQTVDDITFDLCAGENNIPYFSFLRYAKSFFYILFGRKRVELFSKEFSCFASGRKKIKEKKLLRLLTMLCSINETQQLTKRDYNNIRKEWQMYYGCDYLPLKFNDKSTLKKYKKIYNDAFNQLKLRMDLHFSKVSRCVSYVALCVAVLGVVVSIIIA